MLAFLAAVQPGPALCAQSLDEALTGLPGYRARPLERLQDWNARPQSVLFAPDLLAEWALQSYSRWELTGTRTWELRVWEMRHPQGAFGLFTEQRWKVGPGKGRILDLPFDNFLSDQGLGFWRDRRFFLLRPAAGPPPDDPEWTASANAISEGFGEPNLYPFTLVQLPLLDLDPDSVRFFLGERGLRSDPDFPPALIRAVGFEKEAEAISARYGASKKPFFLFGYPTASLAEQQAAALNGALQSHYAPEGVYMKRSALLVGVFFGPEAEARTVLDQLQYNAKVQWIYDRGLSQEERARRRGEVISFFGIVTSSILFTGAFAVVVIVAGLATGLVRYQVLKRFPILTANKGVIRLDL